MAFLGIDFGSRALKGAIVEQGRSPALLSLGALKYLPNLCCTSGNQTLEKALSLIEQAYRDQRMGTATEFVGFLRDQATSPKDSIPVNHRTIGAVDVHRWPLAALRQALSSHAPLLDGVVVSIPDVWRASILALPVAMASLQLSPLAFVPESLAAVVSEIDLAPLDSILAVSLGAGTAHASLLRMAGESLSVEQSWKLSNLGGRNLRDILQRTLADHISMNNHTRIEDDKDAQRELNVWIDRCFANFSHGEQHDEPLIMYGKSYLSRSYTINDLFSLLTDRHLSDWHQMYQSLRSLSKMPRLALAWGETSFLAEPLFAELGNPFDLQLGKLDCVALGCSILAQDLSTSRRGYFEGNTPVLRTSDGGRTFRANLTADVVPILHPLHCPQERAHRELRARLLSLDSAAISPVLVDERPLRIGRDSRSELVIDSRLFPMVSGAHALVVADGSSYLLRDLGSRNGTYLNGKIIDEAKLVSGDRIRLGLAGPEFLFRIEHE